MAEKQRATTIEARWELFWRYWLPVLAMLTLIKMESTDTMSGAHTHRFLARLILWLGLPIHGATLDLLNLVMRKSGHMLGYGLLCLSWLFLLRGSYWLRHEYQLSLRGGIQVRRLWWRIEWGTLAVLLTFTVACADEFHQMTIPSRDGAGATWVSTPPPRWSRRAYLPPRLPALPPAPPSRRAVARQRRRVPQVPRRVFCGANLGDSACCISSFCC